MPNIRSAQKRCRQTVTRTARNKARMNRIRTYIRSYEHSLSTSDPVAIRDALRHVTSELHRGVRTGVLHWRTAARKISRLSRRMSPPVGES